MLREVQRENKCLYSCRVLSGLNNYKIITVINLVINLFLHSPKLVKSVRLVWVTNPPPDDLSGRNKWQKDVQKKLAAWQMWLEIFCSEGVVNSCVWRLSVNQVRVRVRKESTEVFLKMFHLSERLFQLYQITILFVTRCVKKWSYARNNHRQSGHNVFKSVAPKTEKCGYGGTYIFVAVCIYNECMGTLLKH